MSTDFTPQPNDTPGRIVPTASDEWRGIGLMLRARGEQMRAHGQLRLSEDAAAHAASAAPAPAAAPLRGPYGMAVRSTVVVPPDDPEEAIWNSVPGKKPPRAEIIARSAAVPMPPPVPDATTAASSATAIPPPRPMAPAIPEPGATTRFDAVLPFPPFPSSDTPAAGVAAVGNAGWRQPGLFDRLDPAASPRAGTAPVAEPVSPTDARASLATEGAARSLRSEPPPHETSDATVPPSVPDAIPNGTPFISGLKEQVIPPGSGDGTTEETPDDALTAEDEFATADALITPFAPSASRRGLRSWLRCAFFGATALAALSVTAGWRPWAVLSPSPISEIRPLEAWNPSAVAEIPGPLPVADPGDGEWVMDEKLSAVTTRSTIPAASLPRMASAARPNAQDPEYRFRDHAAPAPRMTFARSVPAPIVRYGSRRPSAVLTRSAAPASSPAAAPARRSPSDPRVASVDPTRGELALLHPTPDAFDRVAESPDAVLATATPLSAVETFSTMAAPKIPGRDGERPPGTSVTTLSIEPDETADASFRWVVAESAEPAVAEIADTLRMTDTVATPDAIPTAKTVVSPEPETPAVAAPSIVASAKAETPATAESADTVAPSGKYNFAEPIPGAWLMIHADKRTAGLCVGREYVKVYSGIGVPRDPSREKLEADDGRTPQGRYFLGPRLDDDAGPRLILSWPAPADARRVQNGDALSEAEIVAIDAARKTRAMPPQDTALGGGLAIVGHGDDPQPTDGGFALTDDDVRELARVLPENAWVVIE